MWCGVERGVGVGVPDTDACVEPCAAVVAREACVCVVASEACEGVGWKAAMVEAPAVRASAAKVVVEA